MSLPGVQMSLKGQGTEAAPAAPRVPGGHLALRGLQVAGPILSHSAGPVGKPHLLREAPPTAPGPGHSSVPGHLLHVRGRSQARGGAGRGSELVVSSSSLSGLPAPNECLRSENPKGV